MLKHCIVLYLLVCTCISATAQKHDYMWLMAFDRNLNIPGVDGYIMDFNESPVDIYYITTTMNLQRTNASICDTAGNLLFYTNGVFIANAIHEQMQNGDGFTSPFPTRFYLAQLAPDDKIYINSTNGVDVMHVINNPDLPGANCDVCQHCVQLPTYNAFSMPNFPNYRLGALEGSPCDTLRQLPTAAWSYDAQALELAFQDISYHDIRAWHWDFGDGMTDTVPHPVHSYAAEGVYNVCLAVSNPRGVDTLCREVQVIVNDIDEAEGGISASISPNPVSGSVTANLFADLGASANKFAVTASLRDALGREVLREPLRVVNGKVRQELKIGHLAAGVYFCSIEAEGSVVWQGKVVKQ